MRVDEDTAAAEELAFGPVQRRRWPQLVLVAVVALVAVAGLLDSRQRDREIDDLLAAVEASESTMRYAEQSVAATLTYASPALLLLKTPEPVRADLVELVRDAAQEGVTAVGTARTEVTAVDVWAWHGELEQARTAYLAYLDHRTSRLESRRSSTESSAETQALLRAASDELRSAVGPEDAARVDQLLDGGVGR
jgi:hypothetical protein